MPQWAVEGSCCNSVTSEASDALQPNGDEPDPHTFQSCRDLRDIDACSTVTLAMSRHFLWIDLTDLEADPTGRCSEDRFTGPNDSVCEQLMLDAPRELFVIAFWIACAELQ